MLCVVLALAFASAPADLVVRNARIWSDGLPAFAESLAVRDGRFVHVGGERKDLVGPHTQVVDAGGRVIVPGLIDSHIHMVSGGLGLSQIVLRDARDRDDLVRRVREFSEGLPTGKWLIGGRWSVESWTDRSSPRKEWIDAATRGRPAFITRMDGHSALANSEALRLAGITATGPKDPEGGVIERDASGEPTGILKESAMGLVSRLIPPASVEDRRAALGAAIRHVNAFGVTAVADITSVGATVEYGSLPEAEATCRMYLYPVAGSTEGLGETAKATRRAGGWYRLNGFKAYLDGTLGSRTAMMAAPFLGNPAGQENWRGLFREGIEDGRFARNVATAAREGVQTIAHAIGDEANRTLLDILSNAYGNELKAARCRSEHAQHLLPEDIERFARLGVIASMQPYHKADDGRYAESYLGEERCKSSYAFRSLLDRGAVVVFGSDWPVVSANPWLGVEAAVTGKTLAGQVWMPQENLAVAEALRCYTSRAAYAVFAEDEIGRIAPGLRADFLILNRSPFDKNVEWGAIQPESLYFGGKRVEAAGP